MFGSFLVALRKKRNYFKKWYAGEKFENKRHNFTQRKIQNGINLRSKNVKKNKKKRKKLRIIFLP